MFLTEDHGQKFESHTTPSNYNALVLASAAHILKLERYSMAPAQG